MPRTLTEQEYSQVVEQVMASAPPNMDEATFTKWIGPQMDAALAEAEGYSAKPEGSAGGRFLSNMGSMLNPVEMAKGAYQAVTNPIDTVVAAGGAMKDQWRQGIDLAKQGRYVEGAGHMAAGSIPLIGPTAAAIAEQGAEGDIAGMAGATAGLLAPIAVKPAVQGMRAMTPKGLRATIAERLEAQASKRYRDTMAPTVGPNKTRFGSQADRVAPALAKDPAMGAWSREGLHAKVQQGLEQAKAAMDEAADASLATGSFETQPILDAMKTARQKLVAEAIDADRPIPSLEGPGGRPTPSGLTRNIGSGRMQRAPIKEGRPIGIDVEPGPNAPRIASLDQVIAEVEQLGPLARYESLRRIRQAWDSVAKQVYMPSPTADLLKLKGGSLGAADATGVLRDSLAKASPEMAAANAKYSLFKTAQDVLDATAEVERTRPKVGRHIIAKMTGTAAGASAAGPAGAVAGYVLGPIVEAATAASPTIRLQTAQLMAKLAGAIRAGNVEQVSGLVGRLRQLAPASSVSIAQQAAPGVAAGPANRPEEVAGR